MSAQERVSGQPVTMKQSQGLLKIIIRPCGLGLVPLLLLRLIQGGFNFEVSMGYQSSWALARTYHRIKEKGMHCFDV